MLNNPLLITWPISNKNMITNSKFSIQGKSMIVAFWARSTKTRAAVKPGNFTAAIFLVVNPFLFLQISSFAERLRNACVLSFCILTWLLRFYLGTFHCKLQGKRWHAQISHSTWRSVWVFFSEYGSGMFTQTLNNTSFSQNSCLQHVDYQNLNHSSVIQKEVIEQVKSYPVWNCILRNSDQCVEMSELKKTTTTTMQNIVLWTPAPSGRHHRERIDTSAHGDSTCTTHSLKNELETPCPGPNKIPQVQLWCFLKPLKENTGYLVTLAASNQTKIYSCVGVYI